jgi:membrane protein implicated in regulation of membrane protease activity
MPLGSRHDETGLLLMEHGALLLRRDDGGRWRLEADLPTEPMLGRRVRVQGVRGAFDMLVVERISLAD